MTLTLKRRSPFLTEEQWNAPVTPVIPEQTLPAGTQVKYQGHVIGGMVKALHEGRAIVIHPSCTREL